jgi:ABC-type glycerol-3-phosphate transport system permease component
MRSFIARREPIRSAPDRIAGWLFERLRSLLLYLLMLLAVIVLLVPVAWMVSTAFKSAAEVFSYPPKWIPEQPTLDAFREAFGGTMMRFLLNSVIVATGTTALATAAGALTAYALSRFPFRGSNAVLMFFLSAMAFPIPLLMISMYLMFARAGLLNSYPALILAHTVITLPICVWLLKSFFDSLPVDMEESAYIDGAGALYTLWHIVLPMARPGLAAAAIFAFVTSWNEFMFGLTFTSSTALRPLPAGISLVFLQEFQYRWPEMMAVAILATVPILLLFVFFQKSFMEGLTAGALKG